MRVIFAVTFDDQTKDYDYVSNVPLPLASTVLNMVILREAAKIAREKRDVVSDNKGAESSPVYP